MFLGVFVLGHRNNVINYLMQTLTLFIYLVVLPSIFLLNDDDTKSGIVESNLYKTILTIFHCNYNKSEETEEGINEDDDPKEDQDKKIDPKVDADDENSKIKEKATPLFKRTFKKENNEVANTDDANNVAEATISNQPYTTEVTISSIE